MWSILGLAPGAKYCQRLGELLIWITKDKLLKENIKTNIYNFYDDFFGGDNNKQLSNKTRDAFNSTCNQCNVIIKSSKSKPLRQKGKILGVHADTTNMTFSIPSDKVIDYNDRIDKAVSTGYCTVGEGENIFGILMYYSGLIWPLKAMLRALIRLIYFNCRNERNKNKIMILSERVIRDLKLFRFGINNMNGINIEYIIAPPHDCIELYTDASLTGIGAYCNGSWIKMDLPMNMRNWDIGLLEGFALICAFRSFKKLLKHKNIRIYVDNIILYCCVKLKWAQNNVMMCFIYCMVKMAMNINADFGLIGYQPKITGLPIIYLVIKWKN